MNLINTVIISNSSVVSDTTSFLMTNYNLFCVHYENIIPASSNQVLNFQVFSSSSSAFQTTGYLCSFSQMIAGGAAAAGVATTNIPLGSSSQNSVAPGISGQTYITDPSKTTAPKWVWGYTGGQNATPAGIVTMTAGYWNANGAVGGFRILFASGNITSGIMRVYGINS